MATTIRNEKLLCLNCGDEYVIKYPIAVDKMTRTMEVFNKVHKDCKKTWQEPEADLRLSMLARAYWWMENGETGMSSKTMWFCLMGQKVSKINHPDDPYDFSRCWKLLECVPEWKAELDKLKPLSKAWSNLVDNWDKLNEFYEDMRKVKKGNGMYEFMQELIK